MRIVTAIVLALTVSNADAMCVDPTSLMRGVVYLQLPVVKHYRKNVTRPVRTDDNGSGWFSAERVIVTNEHVVDQLGLTTKSWSEINIGVSTTIGTVERLYVRKARLILEPKHYGVSDDVLTGNEDVALIEIDAPIPGSLALPVSTDELGDRESIVAAGFRGGLKLTDGYMLNVRGDFQPNPSIAEMTFLHLNPDAYGKEVLGNHSSGGPVFNCKGEVAAMISIGLEWLIDVTDSMPTDAVVPASAFPKLP